MANALQTLFFNIAQAIRDKGGKPDSYKMAPATFPKEIRDIPMTGGGSGNEDFVTVLPEQWVNTPYNDEIGCYNVIIDIDNTGDQYGGATGDNYVVWFDGIPYALPLMDYKVDINNGVLTGTLRVFGNPKIQTKVVINGTEYSYECEDGWRTEPFNFSISDHITIRALSGDRHKVRVEYVPIPKYTVSFYNGSELLWEESVEAGQTVPDPLSSSSIEIPTKESSEHYDYEYAGWSLTNGGEPETETALSAVIENRRVYAAYTSIPRPYTISFYDGETLLTSTEVGYGLIPSYTPSILKNGYMFSGWNPTPSPVTGNASYYAVWVESEYAANGTCGNSAEWFLLHDGTLQITGSGAMEDYASLSGMPWNPYRSSVTKIEIAEGITRVGSYAFPRMSNCTTVTLPSSLIEIGEWSFYSHDALTAITLPSKLKSIENNAFASAKIATLTIPSSVSAIGPNALSMSSLKTLIFQKTSGWYRTQTAGATSGITVASSALANSSTAATYLKTTYKSYYWYDKT